MAQLSCSLECIVLFPGDAVGRMGLVSASGYSVSVDMTTLWGAGLETRTHGQSKCLAKNTEPVLFLSRGTVCADGSQTQGISIRVVKTITSRKTETDVHGLLLPTAPGTS